MKKTFLLLAALIIASTLWAQTFTFEGIKYQITSETTVMVVKANEPFSDVIVDLPHELIYNSLYYKLTAIGRIAFSENESFVTIHLPDYVTEINESAFNYCTSLSSVLFSEWSNLQTIKDDAFHSCTSLSSFDIPANVTSLGDYAFKNCEKLETITCLGSTPPSLGTDVFSGCNALFTIIVPEGAVDAYKTAWSSVADKVYSLESFKQVALSEVNASATTAIEAVNASILSAEVKADLISRINSMKNKATQDINAATNATVITSTKDKALDAIHGIVMDMELMTAKPEAIDAKIAGVEDSEILAIANDAKARIEAATSTTDIDAIKNKCLSDLEIPVKYYNSAKAQILGTMGEEKTGNAVKVTKGDKTIILYGPDKVDFIKVTDDK